MNHAVPGWRSRASAIMSCNARRWGTADRFMSVLVSNDYGEEAPVIQARDGGVRACGQAWPMVAPPRAPPIRACNARRWGTEERFMRVLVSNDVGVDAPVIQALARGLRAAGQEVLIVAPDRDRSGASNSLTLDAPVRVVQQEPAVWRVHGTPTDCVHVAITGMLEDEPRSEEHTSE